MNADHLDAATRSFDDYFESLRKAHSAAIESDDRFAEIVLFDLLERSAALQQALRRTKSAAISVDQPR
jgi:hypothetical protein